MTADECRLAEMFEDLRLVYRSFAETGLRHDPDEREVWVRIDGWARDLARHAASRAERGAASVALVHSIGGLTAEIHARFESVCTVH